MLGVAADDDDALRVELPVMVIVLPPENDACARSRATTVAVLARVVRAVNCVDDVTVIVVEAPETAKFDSPKAMADPLVLPAAVATKLERAKTARYPAAMEPPL